MSDWALVVVQGLVLVKGEGSSDLQRRPNRSIVLLWAFGVWGFWALWWVKLCAKLQSSLMGWGVGHRVRGCRLRVGMIRGFRMHVGWCSGCRRIMMPGIAQKSMEPMLSTRVEQTTRPRQEGNPGAKCAIFSAYPRRRPETDTWSTGWYPSFQTGSRALESSYRV